MAKIRILFLLLLTTFLVGCGAAISPEMAFNQSLRFAPGSAPTSTILLQKSVPAGEVIVYETTYRQDGEVQHQFGHVLTVPSFWYGWRATQMGAMNSLDPPPSTVPIKFSTIDQQSAAVDDYAALFGQVWSEAISAVEVRFVGLAPQRPPIKSGFFYVITEESNLVCELTAYNAKQEPVYHKQLSFADDCQA